MKVILGAIKEFNDDALIMARQLGAEGFHFNTPPIATSDENYWTVRSLKWLKEYTEKFELKLEMIENVPIRFFDKILLGLPGRDEQIENYIKTLHNMGEVGIPILGHHFCPTWAWRTTIQEPYRLGAFVSAYDHAIHDDVPNAYTQSKDHMVRQNPDLVPPTAEDLWNNFTYFAKAVLPEAEKAGVKLITHPSDPPIAEVAGVARIFICPDDFRKAEKIVNSDAWGINFCMGTFSQLGGEETVLEMINEFVPKNRIHMVHFRDVQGTIEKFSECFLGEGRYNPATIMRALKEKGYESTPYKDRNY
jgi:mannonate dehydratase